VQALCFSVSLSH